MSASMQYYSHGKLLLSAEYLVLEGAEALAIPVKYGQKMEVENASDANLIQWQSMDVHRQTWFQCELDRDLNVLSSNSEQSAQVLQQTLRAVIAKNAAFANELLGKKVVSTLEFERDWGFGSSATFINNLATWGGIDAFELNKEIFSGSGYDIACARADSPILYQLKEGAPVWNEKILSPAWNDARFIFLNRKQSSKIEVTRFKNEATVTQGMIKEISELTQLMATSESRADLIELVKHHDILMGKILNKKPVKDQLFSDFNGAIKSLGAWGGDFILAIPASNQGDYFKEKGYPVSFSFEELRITKHL